MACWDICWSVHLLEHQMYTTVDISTTNVDRMMFYFLRNTLYGISLNASDAWEYIDGLIPWQKTVISVGRASPKTNLGINQIEIERLCPYSGRERDCLILCPWTRPRYKSDLLELKLFNVDVHTLRYWQRAKIGSSTWKTHMPSLLRFMWYSRFTPRKLAFHFIVNGDRGFHRVSRL